MARREVKGTTDQGMGQNPLYQLVNFLTYGLPQSIQKSSELQTTRGEEIQQKAKGGDWLGAIGQTVNPLDQAEANAPMVGPAAATAGTYVGVPMMIKALLPYLTYGGINKLLEKKVQQDTTAATGSDIQSSLVDKLTKPGYGGLGNVRSDVETIVNDILNKQMQGGFSRTQPYTTQDIYKTAQNVGSVSNYSPGELETVRQGLTGLIKDIVPETQGLYKTVSALSKIPEVPYIKDIPFVGSAISPKNPWTWPAYAAAGKGALGSIKGLFK